MTGISSSKPPPHPERGGFWARQTRQDKITLLAFVVQVVVTLVLLLIGLLVSDAKLSLGGRFALLSANIVALGITLQLVMGRFFDDERDELKSVKSDIQGVNMRISQTLDEMESITALGETYIKIFRQDERSKNQYQNTLDAFLLRLSNCIDDRRSGALDIMDYYGVLDNLATEVEDDKGACDSAGTDYNGGIWALTFLLDDEWDDGSIHEIKWFETLKRLDQAGIPTRRLWAFDRKMLALIKKEPIEEDGRELIRRLSLYCANDTAFKNTESYILPKEEILDEHVRLFGKGFFAAAFSTNEFSLIRGVCFDNLLSSNTLGGEIDFDEVRIQQIRRHWERYLALAKPLKAHLHEAGSDSARQLMESAWTSDTP